MLECSEFLLTITLLQQASRMTWSCSSISYQYSGLVYGYGSSGGEEVICEPMPGQLIVAAAVFWAIMLFGLLLWIATRRLIEAGSAVADR